MTVTVNISRALDWMGQVSSMASKTTWQYPFGVLPLGLCEGLCVPDNDILHIQSILSIKNVIPNTFAHTQKKLNIDLVCNAPCMRYTSKCTKKKFNTGGTKCIISYYFILRDLVDAKFSNKKYNLNFPLILTLTPNVFEAM
jgi:hypothetical protein